jgi:hypothetical protein
MRPSKFKPPKIQELITSCYKPKVPANNICNKLPKLNNWDFKPDVTTSALFKILFQPSYFKHVGVPVFRKI